MVLKIMEMALFIFALVFFCLSSLLQLKIDQDGSRQGQTTGLDIDKNPVGTPLSLTAEEFGSYIYDGTDDTTPGLGDMGDNGLISWTGGPTDMIPSSDVTPIPNAFLLFCSGLVVLVGFRRKNRQ